MIAYSYGTSNDPPFEVLHNAPAIGVPETSAPSNVVGVAGVLVSFDSGTGSAPGTIVVTNGATGKTVSRQLQPNMTADMCLQVLQQAAFDVGLQIQSDPKGLKLGGANSTVNVTGANVTLIPY